MKSISEISGATRLYAIIADPIIQVKTPQVINALFEQVGHEGVMVPFHVTASGLPVVIAGLRSLANLEGFIVTVPHKTAMLSLCDQVTAHAQQVGAVNVVRRSPAGELIGDILDGIGFVAGLRQEGFEPAGASVYLAGAGGAANAIAFALAEAGVARLTVANRTAAKAEALLARLRAAFPTLPLHLGNADPSGHTLVVNATSLGLREGDPLPCDTGRLSADQWVAEIIMQPARTPLLLAAAAQGCRVQEGLPMLLCQARLMARAMGAPVSEGAA
ncbi:shikimate dehydrogenase family protein [Pseudomonas sp. Marseille-Q5115]|uniref:shikimate dehydrogenase family protein n=1 Tax=Pseudomonas sp. Marseille-Q5115 TaxID=2866593 RepID=UPI001CE41756|nr:shikimate dehydrogenase [Pseudomonas sp. Marseille-Q5115]